MSLKNKAEKDKTKKDTLQGSSTSEKERDALVEANIDLVRSIALRIFARLPQSVLLDELISAGSLGLLDAASKFDPEKDVGFRSYAQFRIRGAILDELRSMDWYSRSLRKKAQDIERAVFIAERELGRPADEHEIAEVLELPLEDYRAALNEVHTTALLDLDAMIKDNGNEESGKTFKENLAGRDNPEENFAEEEFKKELAEVIATLSEREQIVLSLYYFEDMTLREIGEIMERTESRICQIHSSALVKLKAKLKSSEVF